MSDENATPNHDAQPRPAAPAGTPPIGQMACPLADMNPLLKGRLVLVAGLILVLMGRGGCGKLAQSAARSRDAKAKLVRNSFDDECYDAKAKLERKIRDLRLKNKPNDKDKDRLRAYEKELNQLEAKQRAERIALQEGKWRRLENAARDAQIKLLKGAYWHQWLFIIGVIVLAAGLFMVTAAAHGAEKIIFLIVLAVMTLGAFFGAGMM